MTSPNTSLEHVYRTHHEKRRGVFFVIHKETRGAFLREKIGTGKKVLDIGCRDGALTSTYMQGNDVLGADIDAVSLGRAHEAFGLTTRHMDLLQPWGLPENSFDVVVAAEVLEHVYYTEELIVKIKHVLRQDGMFVGSIPILGLQVRLRLLMGTKSGTPLQDPTHINHFFYGEFRSLLLRHFKETELVPVVSRKFSWLPFGIAHFFASGVMFYARYKA